MTRFVGILLSLAASAVHRAQGELCTSDTNTFTVGVDLFAGELGYFYFEECGKNNTNPTIGIEVGQVYKFVQTDRSNYMHPMGFAYFPDGAHVGKNELEPIISEGTSNCDDTATCPAPMYTVDNRYAGTYSNIDIVLPVTQGFTDFGLDRYEPLFYHPIAEWAGKTFQVLLNFDDDTYTQDIFYFCHIHSTMSGRIKLLKNGVPVNSEDTPTIDYKYDQPSEYDKQCGTFNLENYQLPNDQCQVTYVCGIGEDNIQLKQYADCYDSMNCAMMQGMTTGVSSDDPVALFVHQMIPHHQNAVNMAKAVLLQNVLDCQDLTAETDDCLMEGLLRNIINGQNMEIQMMQGYLEEKGYVAQDDCKVDVMSSMTGHSEATKEHLLATTTLLVMLGLSLLV